MIVRLYGGGDVDPGPSADDIARKKRLEAQGRLRAAEGASIGKRASLLAGALSSNSGSGLGLPVAGGQTLGQKGLLGG